MLTRRKAFRSKVSFAAGARSVPIARNTPVRRFREEPRRSSRTTDEDYKAWLRTQVCGMRRAYFPPDQAVLVGPCDGPVDPEHERYGVGMSQKASDERAWACCRRHHDQRHDGRGVFATMTRDELRAFIDHQIRLHRGRYEMQRAVASTSAL